VLIDAYMAELGRALRGPAAAKADLLREARDGLLDAAEAYQKQGLDPTRAQVRAVRDFGPVAAIAPDYQAELGAVQARRTAALICLVLAPQGLIWEFVGGALAGSHRRAAAPGYAVVDTLAGWLGGAALLGALIAALASGVGARYLRDRGLAVRATGYLGHGVAIVFGVTGVSMVWLGPTDALSAAGLPLFAVLLGLPLVWVSLSARRCLVAAPPGGSGPLRPAAPLRSGAELRPAAPLRSGAELGPDGAVRPDGAQGSFR
jgi:hypothetical protein